MSTCSREGTKILIHFIYILLFEEHYNLMTNLSIIQLRKLRLKEVRRLAQDCIGKGRRRTQIVSTNLLLSSELGEERRGRKGETEEGMKRGSERGRLTLSGAQGVIFLCAPGLPWNIGGGGTEAGKGQDPVSLESGLSPTFLSFVTSFVHQSSPMRSCLREKGSGEKKKNSCLERWLSTFSHSDPQGVHFVS